MCYKCCYISIKIPVYCENNKRVLNRVPLPCFCVYEINFVDKVAEGARFELADPVGSPVFKTGGLIHSPTPPVTAMK